ncbi:TPA: hypothetical protein ACGD05_001533, partial [Salmonella enterica]
LSDVFFFIRGSRLIFCLSLPDPEDIRTVKTDFSYSPAASMLIYPCLRGKLAAEFNASMPWRNTWIKFSSMKQ